MKKKIILKFLWTLFMVMSLMGSCASKESKEFKVIIDRVIEFTINDFDVDKALPFMRKFDLKTGMCSAVKVILNNKVYVGRNFDFYCSDVPIVIVHNNSGKNRTIGIGVSPTSMAPWTNAEEYKISDELKPVLPFLCSDVMSEKGIYGETNIRVFEQQYKCDSTNPGKKRLCTQSFLQLMLSEYSTIQEILEHINDYDWYDLEKMGFHQSFMLTDKTGYSVVIEFAKNKIYCTESDHNANFFINEELYATQTLPCGELRIQREYEKKDFVEKQDDIFTMMKAGAYDQFYHKGVDLKYATPEFLQNIGYTKQSYLLDPDGAEKKAMELIEEYDKLNWQERISEKTWETSYVNVANVSDLEFNVIYSEHYRIPFVVKFK